MLYVLRLSGGDCIVTAAEDERSALACTLKLADGETVVSVRLLSSFAVRFSPTDSGSLEVSSWDDFSLDDILANEYPILNEAFRRANSVRFMPPLNSDEPLFAQLSAAHEQNTQIIAKGLKVELERLSSESAIQVKKSSAGKSH